jgi:dTDP-4-amino-4,6-dideoxygalactose transaminase
VRNPVEFLITDEGPWHQEVHEFGLNYRLPDVLCALGMSQLERLEQFKLQREGIYFRYSEFLANVEMLELPIKRSYVNPNWHLYSIQVEAANRRYIFEEMRKRNVGVQVNYIPAHWHPVLRGKNIGVENHPVAENYYEKQISLPMHASLSKSDQEYVCETLIEICKSLKN